MYTSQFPILTWVCSQIRVPEYLMGMLLNYVLVLVVRRRRRRVQLCGALSIRDACAHQDLTFYCGQQKKNEFLGLNLCTPSTSPSDPGLYLRPAAASSEQQTQSFASSSGLRVAGSRGAERAWRQSIARCAQCCALNTRARAHTRTHARTLRLPNDGGVAVRGGVALSNDIRALYQALLYRQQQSARLANEKTLCTKFFFANYKKMKISEFSHLKQLLVGLNNSIEAMRSTNG